MKHQYDEPLKAGISKEWNWHPDLPVAVTPLFRLQLWQPGNALGQLVRQLSRRKLRGDGPGARNQKTHACPVTLNTGVMPYKWFGTYHDGTEEMTAVIRDRKRRMHAK